MRKSYSENDLSFDSAARSTNSANSLIVLKSNIISVQDLVRPSPSKASTPTVWRCCHMGTAIRASCARPG